MAKINAAKTIHIEFAAPTNEIATAPIAGPSAQPPEKTASCQELSLSMDVLLALATSGISDLRAVYPAGSKAAPSTAKVAIEAKVRPNKDSQIGNIITEIAEKKSEPIETRLRPK